MVEFRGSSPMLSNRFAFAALAAGCLAAAAGGGYLAVRQNTVPAPAQAAQAPEPAAQAEDRASRPIEVRETEAIVGDSKPATNNPDANTPAPPSPKTAESPRTAPSRTSRDAARGSAKNESAPTPDRSNSSSSASPIQPSAPAQAGGTPLPQVPAYPYSDPANGQARPDAPSADAPRGPEPATPQHTIDDLVVPADSVIGLQMDTPVSSENARVEDRVDARVTRDLRVNGKVAVPAGTRVQGSVTVVDRGGKFKERARLGVRFHTLVLADGTRVPISTDTVFREGEAPGSDATKKIGGAAVGGAILGAIIGGARGAAIGATAGAGAGSAVVAAGDRNAATLPAGTPMTVRLLSPVTVTVEEKE